LTAVLYFLAEAAIVVMSLGLFIFFIFMLVANVAIGYVIAILMGIGPADFRAAWSLNIGRAHV
jgi:hypothetical protein